MSAGCLSSLVLTGAYPAVHVAQVETVSGFSAHHYLSSASSEGAKPRARVNCVAKELAGLAVCALTGPLQRCAASQLHGPADGPFCRTHTLCSRAASIATCLHRGNRCALLVGYCLLQAYTTIIPVAVGSDRDPRPVCAGGLADRVLVVGVRARRREHAVAVEGHDHGALLSRLSLTTRVCLCCCLTGGVSGSSKRPNTADQS